MSTRAYIRIKKDGEDAVQFHHHCDGYPSGVGSDLVNLLRRYIGEWSPVKLGTFINKEDDDFEFIDCGPSWDHEYLYLIDCNKKELSCYYKGITSRGENQEDYFLADKLFIEDNIFDGRKIESSPVTIESDWSSFRREAAKDILCSLLTGNEGYHGDSENQMFVSQAIGLADELIKQLRDEKK